MSKKSTVVLPQTQQILNQIGKQVRLARLRRHLSTELVAERSGFHWKMETPSCQMIKKQQLLLGQR